MLDEAAAVRKRELFTETEDVSRVYDRFFTSSTAGQTDSTKKEEPSRPAESARPAKSARLAKSASLAKNGSLALQNARLANSASLAEIASLPVKEGDVDLMASLPDVAGFTKFFHQITDFLYPQLSPSEQCVHLQLYRLTWGRGEPFCRISLPRLAERSNMSERTTHDALAKLISKGLIKKGTSVIGKGREQGIEYWVTPAPRLADSARLVKSARLAESARLANSASYKEITTYKEHTQTQEGVSVGSRFSLEECRRYAEHLQSTGQGIKNPGGYATTICRTGEADELIEVFINPAQKRNIKDCPDCRGMGFYYPEELGGEIVRKCEHEKLE
jgi:DNA-binding Lrp family transcriptional regulator